MYICEVCKTRVGPRIGCNVVVVERRSKIYPPRIDGVRPTGYETVKEVKACSSCAPVVQLTAC